MGLGEEEEEELCGVSSRNVFVNVFRDLVCVSGAGQ